MDYEGIFNPTIALLSLRVPTGSFAADSGIDGGMKTVLNVRFNWLVAQSVE
jgi:hypothetical protein